MKASERDLLVFNAVKLLAGQGYGNSIHREINAGRPWWRRISFGRMYESLYRLEQVGAINSRWSERTFPERGHRRRRYAERWQT